MKRRVLQVLAAMVGLLVAGAGAAVLGAELRWRRTFEASEPAIHASADPEVIARGRYLAYGPSHCASCHTANEQLARVDAGEEPPLSGGHVFALPLGTVRSPNLTPDPETGRIAAWTEAQFVARFRAGKAYEKSHMPWGAFGKMSDDDLRALYRYLRTLPATRNPTGPSLQRKEAE